MEVCDDVTLVVPYETRPCPSRHLQNIHRERVPLAHERADVHHTGRGLCVGGGEEDRANRTPNEAKEGDDATRGYTRLGFRATYSLQT